MKATHGVRFRVATSSDVPAMAALGRADPRMAAYFDGQHHPGQSLLPRIGYVALASEVVVGYIAGHLTTRHGCDGEVQYLFVSSIYRRRRIGTALLQLLADWFREQGAQKVCIGIANDSPPEARPFYESAGASPLQEHWFAFANIGQSLSR
jgi:GNAT superfamily N-acetyltransferase